MHTLRKKLVPALITSLCTILLPLSGCKIVPNDQRASSLSDWRWTDGG